MAESVLSDSHLKMCLKMSAVVTEELSASGEFFVADKMPVNRLRAPGKPGLLTGHAADEVGNLGLGELAVAEGLAEDGNDGGASLAEQDGLFRRPCCQRGLEPTCHDRSPTRGLFGASLFERSGAGGGSGVALGDGGVSGGHVNVAVAPLKPNLLEQVRPFQGESVLTSGKATCSASSSFWRLTPAVFVVVTVFVAIFVGAPLVAKSFYHSHTFGFTECGDWGENLKNRVSSEKTGKVVARKETGAQ